ncbi:MAG: 50S ribosomal protein L23 [Candidatus Desulfofervidaceae bacterium]|nr:50S ribosomal protein L23 [Candidatus Desulfofervidaceae bacterium]MDL1970054.1 50S ribosomal protein L23 [Candidatus Desulfofervidaceae bacterium]
MRDIYQIIKRPLITEKTTLHKETLNKVTFEVDPKANKIEIKEAVEKLFNVKVLDVHTLKMKGKKRRMGRFQGKEKDWKKAIVTLRPGDHIEFFEGV